MTEHVDAGWSVREFDGIDLGDVRLNRRLLTIAEAFGAHPQAPINQASADWHDTKAAYAFFDNPHALPAQILLPHQQRTLERMAAHPLVLAIQDTCCTVSRPRDSLTYRHRDCCLGMRVKPFATYSGRASWRTIAPLASRPSRASWHSPSTNWAKASGPWPVPTIGTRLRS
jgi:hypothetical protein